MNFLRPQHTRSGRFREDSCIGLSTFLYHEAMCHVTHLTKSLVEPMLEPGTSFSPLNLSVKLLSPSLFYRQYQGSLTEGPSQFEHRSTWAVLYVRKKITIDRPACTREYIHLEQSTTREFFERFAAVCRGPRNPFISANNENSNEVEDEKRLRPSHTQNTPR